MACTGQDVTIAYRRADAAAGANISGFDLRQAQLYLFVHFLSFLVELHGVRFFGRIIATQLVEHFADGEFVYFGHRNLLYVTWGANRKSQRSSFARPLAFSTTMWRCVGSKNLR